MSDYYTHYDNEGRTTGYSRADEGSDTDGFIWLIWIAHGIMAAIIGVLFGVGTMLKVVFWYTLIVGGITGVICLFVMGISKLNEILEIWTNGHAKVVWTVLGIVFFISAVSACHNDLVNLLS